MNPNGGTIAVTLKLDDKQFTAAAARADATGRALGKGLDDNVTAATSRTEERFGALRGIATKAMLGTAAAVTVAGIASVKMAGDFEQSLNVLKSVSGATAEQMTELAAKARELGKDASLPGVSARDAAQAMSELAKAGVGVNDVLKASKGVLSLAKAGNLEVADAATIAARALNAFGLSGDKASTVADVLAAGANASSADVTDMAFALSQAGSSAARMGVSLQDTVTALGLFSNAGVNGSDAGTSLKAALQRLAAPTDEAAGVMKDLGLNMFNAQGNFIGLRSAAQQLQDRLGGLTQQQREQAIAAIFGADASRVAGILAKEGAAGFDEMNKAVTKTGAAQDLAAAQNAGFKGALDNLKSTLETIGTDIGTKLLPPLTKFITVLADNAEPVVNFLIAHGKELAIVITALGTAFAAVRTAAFISDIAKAQKTLALFVGGKNAAGIKALGTAFKFMGGIAVTVIKAIGAAILANPILAAIAAIIAILIYLQVRFNIFGKLFEAIKPILKSVGDFFVKVWQKIVSVVTTAFTAIANFWNTTLKPVFTFIISIIQQVLAIYIKVWAFILLIVVGTLSIIAAVIWKVMQGIWNVISTVFNAIWQVISAVLGFIWGAIVRAFNFYYTIIKTVLGAIWAVVSTIWNRVYGTIKAVLSAIWNIITSIWNRIYGFFAPIVSRIWGVLSGGFKRIYSGVTGILGDLLSFVGGIGGKIVGKIGNFGKLLFDKGKDLIQGLLDGAGSLLSKIGNFFLDKVPGWIKSPFKKALGISSPSKVFGDYGKNIVQGLANGIDRTQGLAVSAAKNMAAQVGDVGMNVGGITAGRNSIGVNADDVADQGASSSTSVTVNANLNGIMTSSPADERQVAKRLIERVNEELRAKQLPELGGGAVRV